MRYKFDKDTLICYAIPRFDSPLNQYAWFVKYGDVRYNFHKVQDSRTDCIYVWKISVVKSKVALALYK